MRWQAISLPFAVFGYSAQEPMVCFMVGPNAGCRVYRSRSYRGRRRCGITATSFSVVITELINGHAQEASRLGFTVTGASKTIDIASGTQLSLVLPVNTFDGPSFVLVFKAYHLMSLVAEIRTF